MNPILARFASQPALVTPGMDDWFRACVEGAASHARFGELAAASIAGGGSDDVFWYPEDDWRSAYRPYVVRDGILFVPVKGVLLHDFPWALGSWATGYGYISKAIERGLSDGNVRGIALMHDTPGGMVAGCFECADRIFAARGTKPIRAFAHESAYSAGYAIASAADEISVSRTGGVGSIGVVTMHVDIEKSLEDRGYKVTLIYAGKHKVDGWPYGALSDDARARIQARIDDLYGIFVAAVSRNRSLPEKVVRDTEALTYGGPEAVANGLADSIGALDDAVAAFAADLSTPSDGDEEMSKDNTSADQAAAIETARAEGMAAGASSERTRILGIQAHQVPGTEKLVAEMVGDGKTTPDQAAARILGEVRAQGPRALDALKKDEPPKVGAGATAAGGGELSAYDRGRVIALRARGKEAGNVAA